MRIQRLALIDLMGRFWDDGQPPGAGDPATPPSGEKRADGETLFTKDQLNAAVQTAINARFGKERGQADRKANQAADTAVQAFRDEHGLDDSTLDKVKSQQSAFDQLQRDHNKLKKDHEALMQSNGELVTRDRNRRVSEALDGAISSFSKKQNLRVIDDAKQDVLASLRPRLKAEDDGSISVLGDDGQPLHVEVGDFVAEQLQSRKYALEPTTTGGAGSRPGGTQASAKKRDLSTNDGLGALYGDPDQ